MIVYLLLVLTALFLSWIYCRKKGWNKTSWLFYMAFFAVASSGCVQLLWTPEILASIQEFFAQSPAKIAVSIFRLQIFLIFISMPCHMAQAAIEKLRGESEIAMRRLIYKVMVVVFWSMILNNFAGILFKTLTEPQFAQIAQYYIPSLCFIPTALYLFPVSRWARRFSMVLITVAVSCIFHAAVILFYQEVIGQVNYWLLALITAAFFMIFSYCCRSIIRIVWLVSNDTIHEFQFRLERVVRAAGKAAVKEFSKQFLPKNCNAKGFLYQEPNNK